MKKLSFLFLALMACVAFANATVYNGTCGAEGDDVIWQLNTSNGELVISGNGAMADYGFNSTPWYEYRDSIISVIIGNSITSIGDYAFSNCTGLTSVTIPNSVTSIGGYAFTSCVNLPSVNIPNNVTSIGSGAFNECHSLTSVNIPDGITDIENNLFLNCKALPSITLPESVTSIGSQAFANCSTLVSINIPQGVTKIDRAAFSYCISLTSLTIPESVTSIGEIAFIHVENVIYSGTATGAPWGAKCMNGYSEGWLAYSDSSKSRLVACSDGAIGDIIIPESVKTIDDQAFSWCSKITSVVIPQDITSIGRMVFYYCTDLLSVTIPSTVTSIGEAAFGNCNKLASIIIPDNVTSIGDYAFSNCESLTSITIPENVTSIGERAFFDCNGFTSVTCEAIEPPTLGASVFRDDFLMYEPFSIPLYVPAQSIDRYNAADQWKDFTNILPIGGYSSISLPIYIELKDNYGRWLSEAAIRNDYDTAFFYSSSFDYSEYLVYAYKAEDNLWRLIGHTTPEYRFIGWKDKDGKVLNQDTLCLYSSDTVIAIVSKQEYHVQVVPDNYLHGYTKAEYGYAGDTIISYGESIEVTAIPREGFQFSRWSDGNTDNPREINILGDLYLTAIFDCQRYGGGWPSEILDTITIERGDPVIISNAFPWQRTIYPNETGYFNDTLLTIFGCDSIVTHYVIVTENKFPVIFLNYNGKVLSRQYVRNGMGAEEPEVPAREGYTFTGWTTDIEHIIDTTYAIAVYDKIGGTVIYKAEDGEIIGSENVDLHLPAAPMISGKTFAGWLTESVDSESGIVLRATYTTDNPTTHDDVSVVPGSTTAAVNFPYITGALTYELVIRDLFGRVVCKILFNSTGHLLGIALAPGRNRTAAPAQTDGFNFTVEGLDPNTTYNYEFVAHDDTDEVIETLSGSFTTTDDISTDVENVQSNNAQCSKVLRNDHVYILRGEKVYSIDGQEVK